MATQSLTDIANSKRQARAQRATVVEGLSFASDVAEEVGLGTAGIFEALAEPRSKLDPDYYTFKMLQYLYEYLPRVMVPVIIGAGCYQVLTWVVQLWDKVKPELKGFWNRAIGANEGDMLYWNDRYVRDGNGNEVIPSVMNADVLKAGLLSIMPPYAVAALTTVGAEPSYAPAPLPAPQPPQAPQPQYGSQPLQTVPPYMLNQQPVQQPRPNLPANVQVLPPPAPAGTGGWYGAPGYNSPIRETAQNVGNTVLGPLGGMIGGALGGGADLLGNIGGAITDGLGTIWDTVTGWFDDAPDANGAKMYNVVLRSRATGETRVVRLDANYAADRFVRDDNRAGTFGITSNRNF